MVKRLGMTAALLLVAGCGSTMGTTSGPQGLASRGYLSQTSTGVAFVQMTVSGTSLSGTIDAANLAANGQSVSTQHGSFSGSESGQSVTLTFSGLGSTTSVSGSINGDDLVLTIPQSTGELVATNFVPSDTNAYNTALQQLQTQASNAVAQATAAAQAAAATQSQWIAANWQTDAEKAVVASSSACVLTVAGHDVRVFVGSGGASICSAAPQRGWSTATDYQPYNAVTCVGTENGVVVAVTDSGGQYYGGIACQDVSAGTFPSTAVS